MATLRVIANAVRSSAVERWGSLLEEVSWTKKEVYPYGSEGIGKGLCTKRAKVPPESISGTACTDQIRCLRPKMA